MSGRRGKSRWEKKGDGGIDAKIWREPRDDGDLREGGLTKVVRAQTRRGSENSRLPTGANYTKRGSDAKLGSFAKKGNNAKQRGAARS